MAHTSLSSTHRPTDEGGQRPCWMTESSDTGMNPIHDHNNDRAKGNQSLPTQPRNPVGLGQPQRRAKKLQAY